MCTDHSIVFAIARQSIAQSLQTLMIAKATIFWRQKRSLTLLKLANRYAGVFGPLELYSERSPFKLLKFADC